MAVEKVFRTNLMSGDTRNSHDEYRKEKVGQAGLYCKTIRIFYVSVDKL